MSWLRLDDGFAANPKIAALTDRELRVWLRVLCYCAQLQDPTVDRVTIREVKGLTSRTVSRLISVGLLDESGDDYEVHHWEHFQPKDLTGATRQARWRARRNANRNGPRNADVDAPDRDENVTSRVGARAQPVPSRPKELVNQDQNPSILPSGPTPEEGKEGISTRKKTEAETADEGRDHYGVPLGYERRPNLEGDTAVPIPDVLKSF